MAKIIGNTTATPMAVPDWAQTNEMKVGYIKNKPIMPIWYEHCYIDYWYYGLVSEMKLSNPKQIRVDRLSIPIAYYNDIIDEPSEEYNDELAIEYTTWYREESQIFDITPDENGNFSITVLVDKYQLFGEETWVDEETGETETFVGPLGEPILLEENIPLTLNFSYGWYSEYGCTEDYLRNEEGWSEEELALEMRNRIGCTNLDDIGVFSDSNPGDIELSLLIDTVVGHDLRVSELKQELNNKLDKIETTSDILKVYSTSVKGQGTVNVQNNSSNNSPWYIARYMEGTAGDNAPSYNGVLIAPNPKKPYQVANMKYVNERFNGSNKAVSFENYREMINSLLSKSADVYEVGQNIMIVTLQVPDLWISSVEENSIVYQYTTDDQIISKLNENGFIQIGYYKLSALETQKVDLSNYYTKEEINEQIRGDGDSVIVIDNELSLDSTNPVQNKVIAKESIAYFPFEKISNFAFKISDEVVERPSRITIDNFYEVSLGIPQYGSTEHQTFDIKNDESFLQVDIYYYGGDNIYYSTNMIKVNYKTYSEPTYDETYNYTFKGSYFIYDVAPGQSWGAPTEWDMDISYPKLVNNDYLKTRIDEVDKKVEDLENKTNEPSQVGKWYDIESEDEESFQITSEKISNLPTKIKIREFHLLDDECNEQRTEFTPQEVDINYHNDESFTIEFEAKVYSGLEGVEDGQLITLSANGYVYYPDDDQNYIIYLSEATVAGMIFLARYQLSLLIPANDLATEVSGLLDKVGVLENKDVEHAERLTYLEDNKASYDYVEMLSNMASDDIIQVYSYIDEVETSTNEQLYNAKLEITDLKNALYGSVLALETDSNVEVDKSILASGVQVGEDVYPIVDNTRALVSEIKGKTQAFNQLVSRPYETAPSSLSYTTNGITFTLSEDVNDITITANGTATAKANYIIASLSGTRGITLNRVVGHKYLIKGIPDGASSTTYRAYFESLNGNETTDVIRVAKGTNKYTRIEVYEGAKLENVKFKLQLFDLTAMGLDHIETVEQFNALFPNEIYQSDNGSFKISEIESIKTTGKNLIQPTYTNQTIDGVTFNVNADGSFKVSGTASADKDVYYVVQRYAKDTLVNGTYYYSCGGSHAKLQGRKDNVLVKTYLTADGSFNLNYELDGVDVLTLYYFVGKGTTINETVYPMLQVGSVATEYEPYSVIEKYLGSKYTLNSAGTIQDKLVITKNEYDDYYTLKKITNVGEIVLTGKETNWYVYNNATYGGFYRADSKMMHGARTNGLINDTRFKVVTTPYGQSINSVFYGGLSDAKGVFYVTFDEATAQLYPDIDVWKSYLAEQYANGTPIKIMVALATPTEEIINEALTLEEVSFIRKNGGYIEVVGNDNVEFNAKPTIDLTVVCQRPNK